LLNTFKTRLDYFSAHETSLSRMTLERYQDRPTSFRKQVARWTDRQNGV